MPVPWITTWKVIQTNIDVAHHNILALKQQQQQAKQAQPGHHSTFSTDNFRSRQAHHQLLNPGCTNTACSNSGSVYSEGTYDDIYDLSRGDQVLLDQLSSGHCCIPQHRLFGESNLHWLQECPTTAAQ